MLGCRKQKREREKEKKKKTTKQQNNKTQNNETTKETARERFATGKCAFVAIMSLNHSILQCKWGISSWTRLHRRTLQGFQFIFFQSIVCWCSHSSSNSWATVIWTWCWFNGSSQRSRDALVYQWQHNRATAALCYAQRNIWQAKEHRKVWKSILFFFFFFLGMVVMSSWESFKGESTITNPPLLRFFSSSSDVDNGSEWNE